MDEGHPISFKVLERGTAVWSSDDNQIGHVDRVLVTDREDLFDGIVIVTSRGERFVDAPEVARIFERAVILTITAAETAELPSQPSAVADRMKNTKGVRRARRWGRSMRDRWENR